MLPACLASRVPCLSFFSAFTFLSFFSARRRLRGARLCRVRRHQAVTVVPVPPRRGLEQTTQRLYSTHIVPHFRWCVNVDVDEFVLPPEAGALLRDVLLDAVAATRKGLGFFV